ncbi:hypothetical protein QBC45DRAFT_331131, partial [Copromyces sp. CBS 386.78]
FIDNIVIFSDIIKEYIKYFKEVFALFNKKGISISFKKLYFRFLDIELFGFKVNLFGLFNTKYYIEAFYKLDFLK